MLATSVQFSLIVSSQLRPRSEIPSPSTTTTKGNCLVYPFMETSTEQEPITFKDLFG